MTGNSRGTGSTLANTSLFTRISNVTESTLSGTYILLTGYGDTLLIATLNTISRTDSYMTIYPDAHLNKAVTLPTS